MEVLGLFYFPTWLFYIIMIFAAYIIYMSWNNNFFKSRGIDGPKPIPVFGNLIGSMKSGVVQSQKEMYQKYKDKGMYGIFEGRTPIFFVCKLELVREMLVKNFNGFVNRRIIAGLSDTPPGDKMLTTLKDDHWKYIRNSITPSFSARKLRRMIPMINEAADSLVKSLEKKAKAGEDIEIKGHMGAYTMDVISRTAFGVKVDSQNDPNNPFVASAKKFFDFSFASLAFIIYFFFPFLLPVIKPFIGRDSMKNSAVFIESTKENIKYRSENQSNYADILQLMLNTRNEEQDEDDVKDSSNGDLKTTTSWTRKGGLTDDEILAQAVLFFVAGYETTANTLSFTLYHLALNPDCCEKVLEEVDETLQDGKPTYDQANGMPYLEMCLNETLRLIPAGHQLERVANEDVVLGGMTIPKGSNVFVPVAGIHYDEEFWETPEKFDPERFTPENKAKRQPFTYMPFGEGPRNCIGMRLALIEAKMALARTLQSYKPVRCDKTEVPLNLPSIGNLAPKKGIWIKLEPRH